jgi:shikimate kinase
MPRENIVLIGFMGSGKSSVGRRIATRLGWRFVDTDRLVVQKNGVEISGIFKTRGEPFFREEERLALESLKNADHCVISTGGGIVTRTENVALLRELGFVVWLTADEEVIFNRVSRNTKRPLLRTANPRETISKLLAERNRLYEAAAQFTFDTSGISLAQVADQMVEAAQHFFAAERKT